VCRAHGYRTAALGKLHLPNDPHNWIADDVDLFDDAYETIDSKRGVSAYLSHLEEIGLRHLEDSWHNPDHYGNMPIAHDAMISELPYEHTHEFWHMQHTLEFIDQDEVAPFCIQLSMQKPHHPLLPQKQFWDMYSDDLALPETAYLEPSQRVPHFQQTWKMHRDMPWEYAQSGETWEDGARQAWRGTLACITQIDDVIGRLMDGLSERVLLDNTVIVYGSAHGCYHTIHGLREKAPGICSNEVCRVPLIWRVPDVRGGQACDALVENVDLTPTLLSLVKIKPIQTADGLDLSPLLRGQCDKIREEAVTEAPLSKSIRWSQFRYVHYPRVMFNGDDHGELYDLESDPWEKQNLYHDPRFAHVVSDGLRRLMDWTIRTTRIASKLPPGGNYGQTAGGFSKHPIEIDGRMPARFHPQKDFSCGVNYY